MRQHPAHVFIHLVGRMAVGNEYRQEFIPCVVLEKSILQLNFNFSVGKMHL